MHSFTINSSTKYGIVKSVMKNTVTTSRIMELEEHMVCTREKRNESKILIGNSQRKKSTGRRKSMRENNVILDLEKNGGCSCYLEKAVSF